MSEPNTSPLGDVAVLGEHFTAVVAQRATTLGSVIVDRVTSWEPQLEQRNITAAQWLQWAPLARAAVLCANPSSAVVAASMLTDALSLTIFAASRKMPMKMENVFREGTSQAFLASIAPSSRATVASRVKALVAGVQDAAAAPTPATAGPNAADADTDEGLEAVEPLLLDRSTTTPEELIAADLTTPAATQALAALALVRTQVKAIDPAALRSEPRLRGRGRAVPYGDVEVIALLAAATTARSLKRRIAVSAAICLGVGAGIAGEGAARLKGADVYAHHAETFGPAVRLEGRLVPLHIAFAAHVLAAAAYAGPAGWLLGGGPSRRNRYNELSIGLGNTDPHLVRMTSARMCATWLAMNAVRGVPLGDLLGAGGWTTTASLDLVLPYLPRTTPGGLALLAGTSNPTPTFTLASAATPTAQVSA